MNTSESPPLTAADLMSRDVKTIGLHAPLRDAAAQLARWEIHGAPVVDDSGRCVGVLSGSDFIHWAAKRGAPRVPVVRTCSFQQKYREPGGKESAVCRLPEGVCPLQRLRQTGCGNLVLGCAEPHCVPTDWQVVEQEALPGETVADFMTTEVATADPADPVRDLARRMLDHHVARLFVLDPHGRPVGVVTANDVLQVMAHPDLTAAGDAT